MRWDAIEYMQRRRCRALDVYCEHSPFLGNELFYVVLLTSLSWYAPEIGVVRRFALLALATCWINNSIKDVLQLPRPPARLRVQNSHLDHIHLQPGFPSTHSAHALSLSWLVASQARWLSPTASQAVAALHVGQICCSRLYIGAHAAVDVAGGLAIGLLAIVLFDVALEGADEQLAAAGAGARAGALLLLVLALFGAYPDRRPENTAFTETVDFAMIYAGCLLATPHWATLRRYNERETGGAGAGGGGGRMWGVAEYLVGLVAVGAVRTALSTAGKAAIRAAGAAGGRWVGLWRSWCCTVLTLLWVVAVHPSWLLAAFV